MSFRTVTIDSNPWPGRDDCSNLQHGLRRGQRRWECGTHHVRGGSSGAGRRRRADGCGRAVGQQTGHNSQSLIPPPLPPPHLSPQPPSTQLAQDSYGDHLACCLSGKTKGGKNCPMARTGKKSNCKPKTKEKSIDREKPPPSLAPTALKTLPTSCLGCTPPPPPPQISLRNVRLRNGIIRAARARAARARAATSIVLGKVDPSGRIADCGQGGSWYLRTNGNSQSRTFPPLRVAEMDLPVCLPAHWSVCNSGHSCRESMVDGFPQVTLLAIVLVHISP